MQKNSAISRWFTFLLLGIVLLVTSQVEAQSLFNRSQGISASANTVSPPKIGLDTNSLLRPTEAFAPAIHRKGDQEFVLLWDIHPDYYLYKDKIEIELKNSNGELIPVTLPSGKAHEDEFFGKQEIYDSSIIIPLTLAKNAGMNTAYFELEAQGCAKSGYCFAPQQYSLEVEMDPTQDPALDLVTTVTENPDVLPPELEAEHDRLSQYLKDNQYLALPLFFLLGLLLTFTPCVLPMLPILSGILTRSGNLSPKKGFTISLVYVLAMAFVYILLGLLAAYFGKGLAAYLQNSYVLIGFGLIFVFLSFSMFGLYQIQMPASIQSALSRVSNQQSSKNSYIGTAIMGMLSALIVGPCVTAPLIGIIGLVVESQNYLLGGSALFAMSMGMGIPLLILGASSGHLLPKAGAWMDRVKVLFGFMLLGLAAYFIGRTLPHYWEQMLYAILSLTTFIWLMVTVIESQFKGRLFFGLLAVGTLTFGIMSIQESNRTIETAQFTQIKGISGLNQALAENDHRITMLEFNADWCVACKEMEKYVFSDPEVKAKMAELQLLAADVTKNDAQDQKLEMHFDIFGPPAMLFFDRNGKEIPQLRVMGSVPKEDFLRHLDYILEHY
ncbi:protein-disulfide reductase DsbD [Ignatzschineria larvae DSM 13226]|uniref:Protein-disulfide reductase DsbD n=1 Tax=Ignatzschineria larvae DSM 13226 TaxID=1111732 RepID=A0ABZ3C2N8_9GAMM|nr:protein-disulfide reductase DsbD [Ignatzschineria larvae]